MDKVLQSIKELGWASLKKIALNAGMNLKEVEEHAQKLLEEGKILKRNRGRGHQFGVPEEEKVEEKIVEEELPDPSTLTFSSIDEYLMTGVKYLPKGEPFDALTLGLKLMEIFPRKWKLEDISIRLGVLVRMNKLKLRPVMKNDMLIYNYVVK